jgi:hypothetical protein
MSGRVDVVTHFQPIANPHDGSRKRVENAENEPAIGKATHSSPKDCIVQYCMPPMRTYDSRRLAGPPLYNEPPEATNKPVPRFQSANC